MADFQADALNARFLAAQAVAREAGLLARHLLSDSEHLDVRLKGPHDFVTAADRTVEALIAQRLKDAFPDDTFLGEESYNAKLSVGTAMLWVVDPIDGTGNFVRADPDWCVSIGFIAAGMPVIGVIYHPASDRLYAAKKGGGARRNGHPIQVSGRTSLKGATVGIDYSMSTPPRQHTHQITSVLEGGSEYRRNGCCTLSLAAVAEGRLDGFAELHLSAWDVTAALVLVREAGGWISDFLSGDGLKAGNPLVACTPALKSQFLDALAMNELG